MNEKLTPVKENRGKVYEFKIDRPLSEEEKRGRAILRRLQKEGFESYFVGGGVRDELMGNPAHDIDIATAAKPEEIEEIFPRAYDRGKQFGVMAVQSKNFEFEIATFRTDIGIADHRRPKKIEFTSPEADVQRRDFTINGLFYDIEKGQIIDFVGGVEDLKKKVIRFIGSPQERIEEDYLRMLRAVRFANRFEFEIDEGSSAAIKAETAKITQVSAERIHEELSKMLLHKNRASALEMLSEFGLLKYILPEAEAMKGVEQPPEFHSEGDVWTHTMMALKNLPEDSSLELAWAVLLHDIAKPETKGERDHPKSKITFFEHDVLSAKKAKKILARLKYSNDFIDDVCWSISQHMRIINAFREGDQQMSERKQTKLFLDPRIDILLAETRADLLASIRPDGTSDLKVYQDALERKKYFENKPQLEKEQVKKFDLITGKDIMEILKIESGPKVGEIKRKIEEAFLEGKISKRDEALKMIKENG